MPLTPEDVSNKRFTPVRLREGYDMGEVDQFLDEIEAELSRLTTENDDLRSKISSAQGGDQGGDQHGEAGGAAASTAAPEPEAAPGHAEDKKASDAASQGPSSQPDSTIGEASAGGGVETIRVATVSEASSAAARLLELATRNADELVDEARADAERIVGEAQSRAETLDSESREKADKSESEARNRSELLDSETAERRSKLFGDLERERDKLSGEVDDLRAFEREYRSRLKSYFAQQLEALDSEGEGHEPTGEPVAPKRLRSVLEDDES